MELLSSINNESADISEVAEEVTNEITNPHPLLDIKDRTYAKRLKILESLSATRRERLKRAAALDSLGNDETGAHWHILKKASSIVSKSKSNVRILPMMKSLLFIFRALYTFLPIM